MRWLIVLPFERPGLMGMDFADELRALGHEVRTSAYRRDNPLYKNVGTKATYQFWILRRLERARLEWHPELILVFKGGSVAARAPAEAVPPLGVGAWPEATVMARLAHGQPAGLSRLASR